MDQIHHIERDNILPPEFDQRFSLDEEADRDLVESIRELGILLPLIVRKKDGKFEIVAGNRRFIASDVVGLPAVPCVITTKSDEEIDKIQLHENLKRLPLSHLDQAITFLHLMEKYTLTETQIAKLIRKSVAYVSQHMCLLNADEELVKAVRDRKLNFTVARELMQVKNQKDLHNFIKYAADDGASSTVVRRWAEESNRKPVELPEQDQQETENPPPRPDSQPGFKCPACSEWHEVRKLVIVRMCEDCNYAIMKAIRDENKKTSLSTTTTPA